MLKKVGIVLFTGAALKQPFVRADDQTSNYELVDAAVADEDSVAEDKSFALRGSVAWKSRALQTTGTDQDISESAVVEATNTWVHAVTELSSPAAVSDLFCEDGLLLGTISQGIRSKFGYTDARTVASKDGNAIRRYFDYFALLEDQRVLTRRDNVAQVDRNVWVNNAWVDWSWKHGPTLDAPLTARMTFMFRKRKSDDGSSGLCIFELHSSALPTSEAARAVKAVDRAIIAERVFMPAEVAPPELTDYTFQATGPSDASTVNTATAGSGVTDVASVVKATDVWVNAVTRQSNPSLISDLFCDDGLLLGTVSQGIRSKHGYFDGITAPSKDGDAIRRYFDYFALLEQQQVLHKRDHVVQVSKNVWVNNAWVNWSWTNGPSVTEPLTARMTFMFRTRGSDLCIFELHSSALPDSEAARSVKAVDRAIIAERLGA